jgi:DNA-binding PadR family transcriptional regulator
MATQENNDDRIALLQEVFLVDHGSLYVALQRLENKKWISAKWGVSENNRKARFYSLTTKGREQLVEKIGEWRRLAPATGLILEPGSRLLGEEA